MNQIIISRVDGQWCGTYRGAHRAEIVELFGTDTLPLGFGPKATEAEVFAAVGNLNPGTLVTRASSLSPSLA